MAQPLKRADEAGDVARVRLAQLVRQRGEDYASLSRMIGRPSDYLARYARRRTPKRLPDEEARTLARYFEVDPRQLGARPADEPQPPRPSQPFGLWLLRQQRREDWIGELARGAALDRGFPKLGMPYDVMKRVREMGVPDMAQAVDAAANEWLEGYGWALQSLIEPEEPKEDGERAAA